MSARAIWQGNLIIQKHQIAVKLYSAVVDRQVHFHLLHKRDCTRVQQRMVDAETKRPVSPDELRKAFKADSGLYVIVTSEEIECTVPKANREIRISRFVPVRGIDPHLFDRPYYLGPTESSATDYFALSRAIERKTSAGIASWVMRKHAYVGALFVDQGYLMLNTLRNADEIVPISELEPPQGRPLEAKEKDLAGKLIEMLSGEFHPDAYHDQYQERVHELINAKRAGKKVKPKRLPRRRQESSLTDSLLASLKGRSTRASG